MKAGQGIEAPAVAELGDEWLTVESLDLDGQGVAHSAAGKVVFIEGALPGEQVRVDIERSKNNWARGPMKALRRESAQRTQPRCPHFGVCGGCKLQHFDVSAQVAVKQRALEDALWHLGKVKPRMVLRPVAGPDWGYRHRARLSMFYLLREQRMLIGFHERQSSHVADIGVCPIMPRAVSDLIGPLHELIGGMDQRERLPQIEVALGSDVLALVLRHLAPLSKGDLARLKAFAARYNVQWWLQPKGPESAHLLDNEAAASLSYELPEYGIRMPYRPTDFTQVNPSINRALVNRAMQLLDAQPGERVIDWFCGMGNFTLPIARRAAYVTGVEGGATLVAQARSNAALHDLSAKTRFMAANLFEVSPVDLQEFGPAQKWLIDPPRDGAFALAKALAALYEQPSLVPGYELPTRIVYVSCDPSTLARDAGLLVNRAGYECSAAGVVNMFPHTAHVESIAVFDRVQHQGE